MRPQPPPANTVLSETAANLLDAEGNVGFNADQVARKIILNGATNTPVLGVVDLGSVATAQSIATIETNLQRQINLWSNPTNGITVAAGDERYLLSSQMPNAVAMVIHPNQQITYHSTIQDAADNFSNNCTLKIMRSFETTNNVTFPIANDSVIDGCGIPIKITMSSLGNHPVGGYNPAAFVVQGSRTITRNLRLLHTTTVAYPPNVNSYAFQLISSTNALLEDCYIQQNSMHYVASTGANPKTFVAVGTCSNTIVRGGAIGQYAAVSSNVLVSALAAVHNHQGGLLFDSVKFYANTNARASIIETDMTESNLVNCSFNQPFIGATPVKWFRNVSALTLGDVLAIAFPGTGYLFTSTDITGIQGTEIGKTTRYYRPDMTNTAVARNGFQDIGSATVITNMRNEAFSLLLRTVQFDYQNANSGTSPTWREVLVSSQNQGGMFSILVVPLTGNQEVSVNCPIMRASVYLTAPFSISFDNFSGSSRIHSGTPAIPTANSRRLIFTTSNPVTVAAGDVLTFGNNSWYATVDTAAGASTNIYIRDMNSRSYAWPVANSAVSNVTTGVDLGAVILTDNIDESKTTGCWFASDGLHFWFNNYGGMSTILTIWSQQ